VPGSWSRCDPSTNGTGQATLEASQNYYSRQILKQDLQLLVREKAGVGMFHCSRLDIESADASGREITTREVIHNMKFFRVLLFNTFTYVRNYKLLAMLV